MGPAGLCVLSLVSKLRFLPQVSDALAVHHDQTPIAIVEWIDVFTIIGWTVCVVLVKRPGYSLQLRRESQGGSTEGSLLTRFSAKSVTYVSAALFFGTLGLCAYFAFKEGRVPSGSWPYISDMFVYPPGNWISRWSLVLGGTMAIFLQACMYCMDEARGGKLGKPLFGVAVLASVGLQIVGICNENENLTLHLSGAAIFFVGYDGYMIVRTFVQSGKLRLAECVLSVVSCVLTFLRFTAAGHQAISGLALAGRQGTTTIRLHGVVLPALEWLNAICIMLYVAYAVLSHGSATTSQVGLALVFSEGDDDCHDDSSQELGRPLTSHQEPFLSLF